MDTHEVRAEVVIIRQTVETLHTSLTLLLDDLDGSDAVQVPRQGRWTRTMLRQLWPRVSHLQGVRALFAVTAAAQNQPVTFTDVLKRSGLTEQQQRNEHARMTRVARELFGSKTWPIEAWQGPSQAGGPAEMIYRMGSTVARWYRLLPVTEDNLQMTDMEDPNVGNLSVFDGPILEQQGDGWKLFYLDDNDDVTDYSIGNATRAEAIRSAVAHLNSRS